MRHTPGSTLLPHILVALPSLCPPYKLAHAWAQPGLLYPQTLFMWHIYSKDWNN